MSGRSAKKWRLSWPDKLSALIAIESLFPARAIVQPQAEPTDFCPDCERVVKLVNLRCGECGYDFIRDDTIPVRGEGE